MWSVFFLLIECWLVVNISLSDKLAALEKLKGSFVLSVGNDFVLYYPNLD